MDSLAIIDSSLRSQLLNLPLKYKHVFYSRKMLFSKKDVISYTFYCHDLFII